MKLGHMLAPSPDATVPAAPADGVVGGAEPAAPIAPLAVAPAPALPPDGLGTTVETLDGAGEPALLAAAIGDEPETAPAGIGALGNPSFPDASGAHLRGSGGLVTNERNMGSASEEHP